MPETTTMAAMPPSSPGRVREKLSEGEEKRKAKASVEAFNPEFKAMSQAFTGLDLVK